MGIIAKLASVYGKFDVMKYIHDFHFKKVISEMFKCFLDQAVPAVVLCYQFIFVVCSKTLSLHLAIHSTMTSSWINN